MRTRFGLAWVLAAVLLAAAAGNQDMGSVPAAAPGAAAAPRPTGTSGQEPTAPAPPGPECNARESLRPQGPLPEAGRMPAGSDMARILERGQLIAGVDLDTYQFASRHPDTGVLEGFDIDIVHDIAQAIFGDPGKVEFRQLATDEQLRQVESDTVDLVVGTLTTTCARRERVQFSAVYFEAGQRVLVNRGSAVTGLADLSDQRVCASRGSTSLQTILTHSAKPVPVGAPSVTECLVMLQLGEVDAVSTDDALLTGLAAQDPRTRIVGPALHDEPYAVVINKTNDELVRFVNGVLERRTESGRWLASYERWLTLLGPPPAPPQPQYRD